MGSIDLTTALARLLSDPHLRRLFAKDRTEAARVLAIRAADRDAFFALDEAALQQQAEGLVSKRRHEVSRLIPQTMRSLAAEGKRLFEEHAACYWPRGHRRHLDDSLAFCRYLRQRHGGNVCRAEFNWLRFVWSERRFALSCARDILVDGRPRLGLQCFYRDRRGGPCQWNLYLRI